MTVTETHDACLPRDTSETGLADGGSRRHDVAVSGVAARQCGVGGIKTVLPALTLGVLPGILLTCWWQPQRHFGLILLLGLGAAVSLGLLQFWTLIGMVPHLATGHVATGVLTALGCAGAAFIVLGHKRPALRITINRQQNMVALVLAGLAMLLYVKGAPFYQDDEDQIHASVVRRLASVPNPAPHNIYMVPGITFTHPFPGTHYFMAMTANLGRIDPLFVYHKLRFLWGPLALGYVFLLAQIAFRRSSLAFAIFLAAAAMTVNGNFADYPGFSHWAQLVPYTHPTDVALGVLLPALLFVCFCFYRARRRRTAVFYFAATVNLIIVLAFSHIPDLLRFFFCNLCLFLALLAVQRDWRLLRRWG